MLYTEVLMPYRRNFIGQFSLVVAAFFLLQNSTSYADEKEKKDVSKPRMLEASMQISQQEAGKKKILLSSPKIAYICGKGATVMTETDRLRIEISVNPPTKEHPYEHPVAFSLVGNPKSKSPILIAHSTIPVSENTTGVLTIADPGGTMTVEATIRTVD